METGKIKRQGYRIAQTVVMQSHGMEPIFVRWQTYYNPTIGFFKMEFRIFYTLSELGTQLAAKVVKSSLWDPKGERIRS